MSKGNGSVNRTVNHHKLTDTQDLHSTVKESAFLSNAKQTKEHV